MRNLIIITMALVLLPAGAAIGAWTEDWENYSHSAEVDAPDSSPVLWDVPAETTGGQVFVNSGEEGPGDAAASMGAGGWTWGTAFRPIDGSEPNIPIVVTAKALIEPTSGYHTIRLSLTTNTNVDAGNLVDVQNNPYVSFHLERDAANPAASFHMRTAASDLDQDNEHTYVPADPNVWYEIRLTDNGDNSVTSEYKLLGATTWTEAATMPTPAGWAPVYVAISGLRQGYIDDISVHEQGFFAGDVNRNFYTDLEDFALLVLDWGNCNDPAHPILCTDAVP